MFLGLSISTFAQYNPVQQQIRRQQWQIQNQQRQIQSQARRMQQQAGLQNRNFVQNQNMRSNGNIAVQFTRLELKHNVPDDNGREMLQCWFSLRVQGVYQHQIQPVLSIEIPQGTSHVMADGSPMLYEGTKYDCVYPGINSINDVWLAYYNDALNPLPGKNTYYVCIYLKDLTTGQYIARSNYLSFTNTGEVQKVQNQSIAKDNGDNKLKGNTNLFQDNIAAAYRGDAEAQTLVGIAYMLGDGIEINYKSAFTWTQKAAEQGFPKAQHNMGLFYENGKGTDIDLSKAVYWYRKAAEQGFANAQSDLAICYINGKGVEKNYDMGVYWARKAADQGIDVAQAALGHCYFEGLGVKQDQKVAVSWFQKAVEQGHVPSQAYLGYCYYSGQGVSRDEGKGEALLKEAAEQGNEQAIDFLAQIEEKKKQEELAANKTPPVDVDINIPETSPDHDIFAVIIGNEKYCNVDGVPFAENDARIFKEYAEKTLGVPERQIMYIENAGYNDLRKAVNWLTQAMDVCRGQGKAIFYYAGHGIPNEQDQSAYLLPVDGVGNDIGSAYSLKVLYETFGKMDAKSVTIFLDACFSGTKRENGMLVSARGVAIKSKPNAPLGKMVVFSAAQGDETAYPYKEKSHGLFTYFLLKKLQESKGMCSLGELGNYVTSQVSRNSIVINKKSQTPTVIPSQTLSDSWKNMKLK